MVYLMIRFCTTYLEMIEVIKESSDNQVCFFLFRNVNTDLTYKGKKVKYFFYIRRKPRKYEKNTMLWWKENKKK